MLTSDRAALAAWLRQLDGPALIALPPSARRRTQSAGHEDAAAARARRRQPDAAYVFWHAQSERAFDRAGALVGELMLHWGGDRAVVARALAGLSPRFELLDHGAAAAFGVRRRLEVDHGLDDATAVRARLARTREDLASARATTLAWLHDVVAAPLEAVRLQALALLAETGDARPDELGPNSRRLPALLTAAGRVDALTAEQWLGAILEALRAADPAALADVRAALARERKGVFQRALARLAADDPWSAAGEAALRAGCAAKDPSRRLVAIRSLVAMRAAHTGGRFDEVALALAADPGEPETLRRLALDLACGRRGGRHRGFLAVAGDPAIALALRGWALERASELLRYATDADALATFEALRAAGLPLSTEAAAAWESTRQHRKA